MMMTRKVDLGCGSSKPEGFIGIDRMAMPGVDIIGDLDGVLPLESDSVDLLFASHSLEHAKDIMHTMREVYRVCKHGAQVCIVAPYYEQKLNVANPYHLNVFNEHTPRFWTNSPTANVELAEYWHPHAETWGLSESDNSDAGVDFRLARMEFFYFPHYLAMTDEERIEARRRYFDVCDQVMYHLVCWKPQEAGDEKDLQEVISSMMPFDPPYVVKRRKHDATLQKAILEQGGYDDRKIGRRDFDKLQEDFRELSEQFVKFRTEAYEQRAAEISELKLKLGAEVTKSAALLNQIHQLELVLDAEKKKYFAYQIQTQELEAKFEAERTKDAAYRSEINDLRDAVDRHRNHASSVETSALAYGEMLEKAWIDGIASAHELSLLRRRRILRLLDRLAGSDMRSDLHAGFAPLLAPFSRTARVCCGPDLRLSAFVPYRMAAPKARPVAIEVALLQAIDNLDEVVGVEVVDSEHRIVWNGVEKVDGRCGGPLRFAVDLELNSYGGEVEVRFFTPSKAGPVHPLEVIDSRLSRRRALARWCY